MHDLTELKRLVGWLDESVRQLQVLLDPGYGGTASELVRQLQEQETRDTTAATRLIELKAWRDRWEPVIQAAIRCEEMGNPGVGETHRDLMASVRAAKALGDDWRGLMPPALVCPSCGLIVPHGREREYGLFGESCSPSCPECGCEWTSPPAQAAKAKEVSDA